MLDCVKQSVTDEELMVQYGGGDSSAFEALYQRHRQPLMRFLLRRIGNQAISEELFQDIWLPLINARARYRVSASFRTWLFRIAHNALNDYFRKSTLPSSPAETANPDAEPGTSADTLERALQAQSEADVLLTLIAQLPAQQRDCFLLKEEAGFSIAEIATIMDEGAETIKSRMRYAMIKLKQGLEAHNAQH